MYIELSGQRYALDGLLTHDGVGLLFTDTPIDEVDRLACALPDTLRVTTRGRVKPFGNLRAIRGRLSCAKIPRGRRCFYSCRRKTTRPKGGIQMDMYPDNVYIQNHKDMLVAFVVFDKRHGLEHDDLAQAQYKHWRAVETGADSLLSRQDKVLLGLIENDEEETEAAD